MLFRFSGFRCIPTKPWVNVCPHSICDIQPEIPALLKVLLAPSKSISEIPALCEYIENLVSENMTIEGKLERQEVADSLLGVLYQFCLSEGHKSIITHRLYRCLHEYLRNYTARSFIRTDNYIDDMKVRRDFREASEKAEENMKALALEFPWLHPKFKRTRRQLKRAATAINRLSKELNWNSFGRRMQEAENERQHELAA
jgi:hypothetical protein